MAAEATLVIDADLPKRIATELNRRGRTAIALSELLLHRSLDPDLLRALADHFGDAPWVLVTGDDAMPAVHPEVINEVHATLATIDPRRSHGYADDQAQDAWRREIVHRWAHKMAVQAPGTIRRYGENGGRTWTRRRR